jgi:cell division protein FtsN
MAPPAAPGPAATATTATVRPAATPPAPRAAAPAPRSGGAPISLEPQAGEQPAAAPPARARTAAIPPPAESAASGFVVQLSSQKSESEAQSSFRSLQAKFPNELGSRQPIIRRADLGSKGVFYRTMIGPFASAQEASQFCANYKAAGGQCVVPNN